MSVKDLGLILNQISQLELRIHEVGGELSPEMERELVPLEISRPAAIDNAQRLLDRVENLIGMYKAEEKEIKASRQGLEIFHERLRDGLKATMRDNGMKELVGEEFRLTLQGVQSVLVITDLDEAMKLYGKEVVTIEIDKKQLRKDLEDGLDVAKAVAKLDECFALKPYRRKSAKAALEEK